VAREESFIESHTDTMHSSSVCNCTCVLHVACRGRVGRVVVWPCCNMFDHVTPCSVVELAAPNVFERVGGYGMWFVPTSARVCSCTNTGVACALPVTGLSPLHDMLWAKVVDGCCSTWAVLASFMLWACCTYVCVDSCHTSLQLLCLQAAGAWSTDIQQQQQSAPVLPSAQGLLLL
jgi:hypothetical protein